MAKDVELLGAQYPAVPAVNLPRSGGGIAQFVDPTELIDDTAGPGETGKTWSAAVLSILRELVVKETHLYGVLWNKTQAQMTRIWDAAGITTDTTNFTNNGTDNASYDNPFDSIYPWSGRTLCNIDLDDYMALIEAGTGNLTDCVTAWLGDNDFDWDDAGGVWVYTPEFWHTVYDRGDGQRIIAVADGEVPGWIHSPARIGGRVWGVDTVIDIDGTDTHVILPTAGEPINNMDSAVMHTYAKNYGATLDNLYSFGADNALYLVEFANFNTQLKLGNGPVNAVIEGDYHPAARTDSGNVIHIATTQASTFAVGRSISIGTAKNGYQIGNRAIIASETDSEDPTITNLTISGAPVTVTTSNWLSIHGVANPIHLDQDMGKRSGYIGTNGWANAYYRGEAFHANRWRYCLGLFHQKTTRHVWIAKEEDLDDYDALNTSVHQDTGIAVATSEGFIRALAILPTAGQLGVCTQSGGDATNANPVGDYHYTADNNTVFRFGGISTSNSSPRPRSGRFLGNSASAASAASWYFSARPLLKNP